MLVGLSFSNPHDFNCIFLLLLFLHCFWQKWNEMDEGKKTQPEKKAKKRKPEIDSYAECYPGYVLLGNGL